MKTPTDPKPIINKGETMNRVNTLIISLLISLVVTDRLILPDGVKTDFQSSFVVIIAMLAISQMASGYNLFFRDHTNYTVVSAARFTFTIHIISLSLVAWGLYAFSTNAVTKWTYIMSVNATLSAFICAQIKYVYCKAKNGSIFTISFFTKETSHA